MVGPRPWLYVRLYHGSTTGLMHGLLLYHCIGCAAVGRSSAESNKLADVIEASPIATWQMRALATRSLEAFLIADI